MAGSIADLPFARRGATCRAHHVLPDSGWVSTPVGTDEDADEAVELLRLGDERARVAAAVRAANAGRDG